MMLFSFKKYIKSKEQNTVPLLFWHFHKTGGTSLRVLLEQFYTLEQRCPHVFNWMIDQADKESLKQYQFFAGHISPETLQAKIGIAPRIITILRQPEDRLISAYNAWNLAGSHPERHPDLAAAIRRIGELSFEEFVFSEEEEVIRCSHNVQARLLAGGTFGTVLDRRTLVEGAFHSDEETLNRARARLQSIEFFGITERMPESVALLCKLFDWPVPNELPRQNVREKTQLSLEFTPRVKERLAYITRLDRQLYDEACTMFENMLKHSKRSAL